MAYPCTFPHIIQQTKSQVFCSTSESPLDQSCSAGVFSCSVEHLWKIFPAYEQCAHLKRFMPEPGSSKPLSKTLRASSYLPSSYRLSPTAIAPLTSSGFLSLKELSESADSALQQSHDRPLSRCSFDVKLEDRVLDIAWCLKLLRQDFRRGEAALNALFFASKFSLNDWLFKSIISLFRSILYSLDISVPRGCVLQYSGVSHRDIGEGDRRGCPSDHVIPHESRASQFLRSFHRHQGAI